MNKREYDWLARHLPAKPAQDIPFCSISPFFSIFTYTWFGTYCIIIGLSTKSCSFILLKSRLGKFKMPYFIYYTFTTYPDPNNFKEGLKWSWKSNNFISPFCVCFPFENEIYHIVIYRYFMADRCKWCELHHNISGNKLRVSING